MTGNTEAKVCSAQLRQQNATVIIQAYNGVDGVNSSIELDFDIGKCVLIDSGKKFLVFIPLVHVIFIDAQTTVQVGHEQLTVGGKAWNLPITIEPVRLHV